MKIEVLAVVALTTLAVQANAATLIEELEFQVFSANADDPAGIQTTVDGFRTALGDRNANLPENFAGGRREIDWDGVPDAFADPNAFPGDFFNGDVPGRARGIEFVPTGDTDGFSVSATAASGTPPRFGFPGGFTAFSEERLFTPIGSTTFDILFFDPANTGNRALSRGFGAVFTDVESTDVTMSFFDINDQLLISQTVAAGKNAGLSFLGMLSSNPVIARISINAGIEGSDSVVMDDFIFGEPTPFEASPVPLPAPLLLLAGALVGLGALRRRAA